MEAIISVIGTLAGTILGWLLNYISQSGKLNIYISSFVDSFQYNKSGYMVKSSSIDQTETYSYKLKLDLYNSSGATKIMRNLSVVFNDGKKDLYKSIPKDDSTKRNFGPIKIYDSITPVNIPAKSIMQLCLHNGADNSDGELDLIWNTKKVYLTYIDEKNRLKRIKIKSEIYRHYFENHKTEEKENG